MIRFLFKLPLVPGMFKKLFLIEDPRLERKVFGLTFKNPVGLAAGFDKDAKLIDELDSLGFGFIEIGVALGFIGLFSFAMLNSLSKEALAPKNHPFLEESIHHHI